MFATIEDKLLRAVAFVEFFDAFVAFATTAATGQYLFFVRTGAPPATYLVYYMKKRTGIKTRQKNKAKLRIATTKEDLPVFLTI